MSKQKKELKEDGRRVFQEFCESISLHGYSYLNNANTLFLKFFWFLVILAMTSSGIALLVQNTNEYLNANIVTTIQSSSSDLKVSIKLEHSFWGSWSETGCLKNLEHIVSLPQHTGLNWDIGVHGDFWWKSGCFWFE